METNLDAQRLLLAFNHIQQHGEHENGGYQLNNLEARSDFDGYNATITDGKNTVTVSFHNLITTDSKNDFELESFIQRLYKLAA